MATVFDTAKYILEQIGAVSTMKLQKLCYYAQVWSLVWDDEPLFEEDFQAWANGPVCRELYDAHKGKYKISANDLSFANSETLTSDQKQTISEVLNHYAPHNAQWLSDLTHMESPWKNARRRLTSGEHSETIITKAAMAEYYGSL